MITRKDQYPIDERLYPNREPDAPAGAPEVGPAFRAQLSRLAPSKVTVLLMGGSSAVKHAAARALHDRSPRAAAPFVTFDCCGRDSEQVESLLFGGPPYAPVGAGAIQHAEGGTLYVATVDALPLLAQPRFLRFLDQERRTRVVASAELELATQVERGFFRLDLAERLTLVELVLPMTLESV